MVIEVFHKATTYVDESIRTARGNQQWLCCVTYIASFDSWVETEREWQGVLDSFGVSESHLTDFLRGKGIQKRLAGFKAESVYGTSLYDRLTPANHRRRCCH